MVAFYIKNDTMILQDGSVRIFFFNFNWTFPFGFFRFLIPCFKLLLTIGMLIPEIPQSLFGNYSQAVYLSKDKKSSQNGKTLEFLGWWGVFQPTFNGLLLCWYFIIVNLE